MKKFTTFVLVSPHLLFTGTCQKHFASTDINKYLNVQGLLPLREQISKFLGKHQALDITPDQVYISPGSKTFLYQSTLLLDVTFLIPLGIWVSYAPQVTAKGGTYKIIATATDNAYKVTARELAEAASDGVPYALILNSPNNPTGEVYSHRELEEIAKICADRNIIVLSDEIYSQLNFDEACAPSIAQYLPEQTLVLGGLSEVFLAGGYRLGFMAVPKEMSEFSELLKSLKSETFSCVSSPIQYAAIKAYEYGSSLRTYIDQQKKILKYIGDYLYDTLTSNHVKCTRPQGGFYMVVDFEYYRAQLAQGGIHNAIERCARLLQEANVALLPGQDFYFDDKSLACRLAFVDFDGPNAINEIERYPQMGTQYLEECTPHIMKGTRNMIDFLTKSFCV